MKTTASEDKLWAVNAGYKKGHIGGLLYYVIAKNKTEAKKKFSSRISWLTVYEVVQVKDKERIEEIYSHPEKYICMT